MPPTPGDHRICIEFLPLAELLAPSVVRLLVRYGVAPMLAMREADPGPALDALRPYLDAGLAACAWPLLDDADGYWPSIENAPRFARRVEALLDEAERRTLRLPWLAVDLEPPLRSVERIREGSLVRRAARLAARALRPGDRAAFAEAERVYAALHTRMLRRNVGGLAIAYPPVAADFAGAPRTAMERLCGAPLRCGWERVSIMTYGSMLAGYSGGMLSVADVRWYSYRALALLGRALGRRAGAFVGIVGHGKLGDEPAYEDPAELAADVAAARAAGIADLNLFCLEGLLARPDPERWLEALVSTPPRVPPFRLRGELLHCSMVAAAAALEPLPI